MDITIEKSTTLGAIAKARPASIPVFERHNLDYCCGGGRTLTTACAERGLDPRSIMEAIDAEERSAGSRDERSWENATMTELAEHIERTHHAFMRDSLARLKSVVPRVVAAHGDRNPDLRRLAEVIERFSEEMDDHMAREEEVLFPWLRRLEQSAEARAGLPGRVDRPIECMIHDHDDAGEALAAMRSLTHGYTVPPSACGTYRSMLNTLRELERDTHIHIHKENNILFPAGLKAQETGSRA